MSIDFYILRIEFKNFRKQDSTWLRIAKLRLAGNIFFILVIMFLYSCKSENKQNIRNYISDTNYKFWDYRLVTNSFYPHYRQKPMFCIQFLKDGTYLKFQYKRDTFVREYLGIANDVLPRQNHWKLINDSVLLIDPLYYYYIKFISTDSMVLTSNFDIIDTSKTAWKGVKDSIILTKSKDQTEYNFLYPPKRNDTFPLP